MITILFLFVFKKLPTYLFIFGCSGSLLLRAHFSSCSELGLRSSCRVWASHRSGFSCSGACALGHRFSSCVAYALKHVGPSWTRDGTYVPCTGRQNTGPPWKSGIFFLKTNSLLLEFQMVIAVMKLKDACSLEEKI